MSTRTTITDAKPEQTTLYLSATITDTDGVTPLANADTVLISLTMTLFDDRTKAIINTCTARNVKNAGGGTVSSAGALVVRLDPADMVLLQDRTEFHVAMLTWTWGSPLKTGRHEVAFMVTNLAKVP